MLDFDFSLLDNKEFKEDSVRGYNPKVIKRGKLIYDWRITKNTTRALCSFLYE